MNDALSAPLFRRIGRIADEKGLRAFVIGGYVRDHFLHRPCTDIDIVVVGSGIEVAEALGRELKTKVSVFKNFGTAMLRCDGWEVEFVGARKESYRADSRKPIVEDGTIEDDQLRRDFTINALYYDPSTQEVLDYHNGYEDLKDKCLRIIGDPEERYREDPVRMMRAVRIAAKLGFRIDESTRRPIPKMAYLLKNVPDARLFDEIIKLLTSGHAVACVEAFRKEGLHHGLLPVLDMMNTESAGEKFMMLALERTDERINAGKKTSPAFLFATLLWPQTLRRWESFEKKGKSRAQALYEATSVSSRSLVAS